LNTHFEDEVVRQARLRANELRSMGFLSAAEELDSMAGSLEQWPGLLEDGADSDPFRDMSLEDPAA
jgi:hypothetical protein